VPLGSPSTLTPRSTLNPTFSGVEGLSAIHVRSGNRNRFELPTHAVSSFLLVTVPSYWADELPPSALPTA
jgi:hypothetical protein